MLQDDLDGDHPQVNRQQLVALHHLALPVLAVVAQQLPVGADTRLLASAAPPPRRTHLPAAGRLPVVVPGEHADGRGVVRQRGNLPRLQLEALVDARGEGGKKTSLCVSIFPAFV